LLPARGPAIGLAQREYRAAGEQQAEEWCRAHHVIRKHSFAGLIPSLGDVEQSTLQAPAL
jgi:hypothetical protein